MNNKERAKMKVADECAETREEDLGFKMVKHYNYLSSLNHEWSNLCELAVKMYLPNKNYIDELEAKNKQLEKLLIEACEEIMKDTITGTYDDWRCRFVLNPLIKELLENLTDGEPISASLYELINNETIRKIKDSNEKD